MIYPIQQAIGRNQVLHYACQQAVDRAMRRLHDGPADLEDAKLPPENVYPGWLLDTIRVHHVARYHLRMKTDETRCRWCGVAADEARNELEDDE